MSSETAWHIEAIIDKPSPESMGMHGLLISNPERNSYEVTGVNSLRFEGRNFQEHELYTMIGIGALRSSIVLELETIDAPDYMTDIPHLRWAGLYVGTAFREKAASHDLDIEPLRADVTALAVSGGTLELDSTDVVYRHLDNWLLQALKQVVNNADQELTALMTRCDSTSLKSQAARWSAAPNEESRNRDLDFILRLSRDGDWNLATDRESLVNLYRELLAGL